MSLNQVVLELKSLTLQKMELSPSHSIVLVSTRSWSRIIYGYGGSLIASTVLNRCLKCHTRIAGPSRDCATPIVFSARFQTNLVLSIFNKSYYTSIHGFLGKWITDPASATSRY